MSRKEIEILKAKLEGYKDEIGRGNQDNIKSICIKLVTRTVPELIATIERRATP